MKKRMKRVAIIVMAFAVTFTSLPIMTGEFAVHAATAKKPAKVTGLEKQAVDTSYITVQWTMIKKNKNTKGYAIYLNGKLYKRVGVKTNRYKIANLKSNTAYKVQVRAYNSYKQKQYYNSKTKKWVVKKPKKKQWKGKKTRSITKYLYGPYSAALSIKTAAVPKAAQPGTTVDNDKWFTNSTLPASETYDLSTSSGYVTYTVNTKGTVTWASINTLVATVSAPSPGDTCRVTFKGVGTTNITAKSALNGKTKTIKLTIKRSDIGTPQSEDDGGIDTPYGKIYPNAGTEKSFNLGPGNYAEIEINGVEVDGSALYEYLPDGSTIYVNAYEMTDEHSINVPAGYFSVKGQSGWFDQNGDIVSSSNKEVACSLTGELDVMGGGLFFVNAGTTTITFSNGKKMTFVVSGRNNDIYNYRNYIKSFVNNNKGKSKREQLLAVIKETAVIPYGPSNYAATTYLNNYGNCYGQSRLATRLLIELGIAAETHNATLGDNPNHMVSVVTIEGDTNEYIVDPVVSSILLTRSEYENGNRIVRNKDKIKKVYIIL